MKDASSFRALFLIGVAAAFHAAFLPHTTKPSVASKLAQTNHPVAVPPAQWLPVFLAASTPGPPTHPRRLGEVTLITTKAQPHFWRVRGQAPFAPPRTDWDKSRR